MPDTADVKEVFGTVIDTVVEQQDEITRLNTTLDRVTTENRIARQKLAQATTDKLQQLLTFQLQLEQQLFDAQKNIQNFAYNIQGYVDEHEDETEVLPSMITSNAMIAKNLTLSLDNNDTDYGDDSNTVQSGTAALFPTEHGAPPGKMMSVQALTTSAFRSAATARSSANSSPARRTRSRLVDDKFNYQMIPPFSFPSRDNVRARWRWSIRKTLQSIRRKQMKVGLTRTRMNKQQTLIERLDNMDERLFGMPQEIEDRMQKNLTQLLGAVGEDLNNLKTAFHDHKLASDSKALAQEEEINKLKNGLLETENRLVSSLAAQQKKNVEDNHELMSQLTLLRQQFHDSECLKLDHLKYVYDDISHALTDLDHVASQRLTELKAAASVSESFSASQSASSLPSIDTADSATQSTELLQQLLENDKEIQAFNTNIAMLEANSETLQRALSDLKHDLLGFNGHYSQRFISTQKYPILGTEEVAQLDDLLSRSKSIESHVKVVKEAVAIMKGVLHRHNDLLRDTAQKVLNQAQQTLTTIPKLTQNLDEVMQNTQSLTQTVENLGTEKEKLSNALSTLTEEQNATRKLVDDNEQRIETFNLPEMARDLSVLKLQIGGVSRGSRPQTGGGDGGVSAGEGGEQSLFQEGNGNNTTINNFISQSGSSNARGGGGGISEQRVFEMISAALDGFTPAMQQQQGGGGGGGVERQDSGVGGIIARAIEAANSNTSSQPVQANDDTFNESGSPGSPTNRRGKMSRKPSGGLHGSFIDYNARRSFIRNSVDQTAVAPTIFDPAPLLADIATLRSEAVHLQKRLDLMEEEKPGKTAIEKICIEQIRDFKRREAKIDHKAMIEDMDGKHTTYFSVCTLNSHIFCFIFFSIVSLREMIKELVGLKKEQERFSGAIRVEFDSSLQSSLAQTKRDLLDATKESVISTKGLCLGCGRISLVKTESSSRPQSPSFLPVLSAHSLPGPDIMRGGFKIPVRTSSPPLHYDPPLQPQSQQQGNGIPLLMKGRVQTAPAASGTRRRHEQEDDGFMSPQVSSAVIIQQTRVGSSPDKAFAAPIDGEGSALRVGFTDLDDDDAGPMLSMPALPAAYFEINSNSITSLGHTDKQQPIMVKDQRSAQGIRGNSSNGRVAAVVRGGDEMLRPLYRRGFPAKKNSFRAETSYAPDRFDLALSNSTSNLNTNTGGRLLLPNSVKPLSAPGGNR